MRSRVSRLAGDQAAITNEITASPSTGIEDPPSGTASPPDSDELISLIRLCLAKMPDQEDFLDQLAELVSTASSGAGAVGAGAPDNNKGAVAITGDRRRAAVRVRNPAQDASLAVRQLNHSSFLKRFPDVAKNVQVWGRR